MKNVTIYCRIGVIPSNAMLKIVANNRIYTTWTAMVDVSRSWNLMP